MKNLRTAVMGVSLTLSCMFAAAQHQTLPINQPDYNKPRLFSAMPQQMTANVNNLVALFSSPVGANVSLNLASDATFRFEGQVVSTASKYDNAIQSVVIRSTNFNGANLTLSRITSADGIISYKGRIISLQNGDLYEIQSKGNQLLLVKKQTLELVNE